MARELPDVPEDALPAYLALYYRRTGGIRGSLWDVVLAARQISVYCHCAEACRRLESNSVEPFVSVHGDPAILLVRSTRRDEFFLPLAMCDYLNEPTELFASQHQSSLAYYGPPAMDYEIEGVHTVCCAVVRKQSPISLMQLRSN